MTLFRACISLTVLTLLGCAHPISQTLRQNVDPSLTFAQIFQSPDSFIGKTVVLGGEIVETRNYPGYAEIEVVQKQLDMLGYPDSRDVSGGRFIFLNPGYLESEIYAKGRSLVGAGTIKGTQVKPLENITYRYPVIEVGELHLWEDLTSDYYYYYPYDRFWYGYSFRDHIHRPRRHKIRPPHPRPHIPHPPRPPHSQKPH